MPYPSGQLLRTRQATTAQSTTLTQVSALMVAVHCKSHSDFINVPSDTPQTHTGGMASTAYADRNSVGMTIFPTHTHKHTGNAHTHTRTHTGNATVGTGLLCGVRCMLSRVRHRPVFSRALPGLCRFVSVRPTRGLYLGLYDDEVPGRFRLGRLLSRGLPVLCRPFSVRPARGLYLELHQQRVRGRLWRRVLLCGGLPVLRPV